MTPIWPTCHSVSLKCAGLALFSGVLLFPAASSAVSFSDLDFERKGRRHIAVEKTTQTPYTGVAIAYDEKGTKRVESYFLNGHKHGPSYRWFADGRLEEQIHWLDGKQHGIANSFYQSRSQKDSKEPALYYQTDRENYQYGLEHGDQTRWSIGRRYNDVMMINGKKSGNRTRWSQDRNDQDYVNYDEHYANGKIMGLQRHYFPDGGVQKDVFYSHGETNGPSLEFTLDDVNPPYLTAVQFSQNNQLQGIERRDYDGGDRIVRSHRHGETYGFEHRFTGDGVLQNVYLTGSGKQVEYYHNTNIRGSERNKLEGESHALQYYWFKTGVLQEVRQFELGKLSEPVTEWYKNGTKKHQVIPSQHAGQFLESEWYDNGQLREQGLKGKRGKMGLHKAWYKSGQLKSEITYALIQKGRYAYSVKHGKETQWYSNGQPKLTGTYHEGEAVGTRRTWLDDGTLYSEKEMGL
ncbi:toxin-antitoxin system YwqK family antitoxin [Photobacterium nomapromontoriensis]|uniref:toxin-antitoxin system YwqK family antitoxin n=1 Tax=Photobacterium nomapromontoriensis TaxID=2910237 RepID=UPI003D0A92F1